jgi:hypothetical protein
MYKITEFARVRNVSMAFIVLKFKTVQLSQCSSLPFFLYIWSGFYVAPTQFRSYGDRGRLQMLLKHEQAHEQNH